MSELVVSAHQPNFLPYLGFFDKMQQSDIFVIRDEVLYVKKEFHNRNRIRINSNDNLNNPQSKWISAPVEDPKDFIMHAKIKKSAVQKSIPWNLQLLHDIKVNYERAPHFSSHFQELERIFDNSDELLISLNMRIINCLKKAFGISKRVVFASELGLKPRHYEESDGSEDLANICRALGATIYLSGAGGRDYLSNAPFQRLGIKVEFQDYSHPIYPQCFPGFLSYMSAIDALFCTGQMPKA